MLSKTVVTALLSSALSIGAATALVPRDELPTATPLPKLAAIYFSVPKGPLVRRQASFSCPIGMDYCGQIDDQIACAPVCCTENGEFTGDGCDLGQYCTGVGDDAGCCPIGRICEGPPRPCADYTDGASVPIPTRVCPEDYPICSSDSNGGQTCVREISGPARTGGNSGLISVGRSSTTRPTIASPSPTPSTTPNIILMGPPITAAGSDSDSIVINTQPSTPTSTPTSTSTTDGSSAQTTSTDGAEQAQATGGSSRGFNLTPAFGLFGIALTFLLL
ncbi:hypothetical protein TWF696_000805 [Orbilia brochopaga]|uniref:Uncharacterized protein n=1 Tax=Orbilia brochopaga TaxID=3140254 RepID=A0AAV9VFF1_9PEZI